MCCVCACVCVSKREKIESKASVNEERWKAQTTDKEARERKNEWCQWWMELIEFEWSIFHRSSQPIYSFRSPNHFILSFCDGSHLNLFHFRSCFRSNSNEYYPLHSYSRQNTKAHSPFLIVTKEILEYIICNDLKEKRPLYLLTTKINTWMKSVVLQLISQSEHTIFVYIGHYFKHSYKYI